MCMISASSGWLSVSNWVIWKGWLRRSYWWIRFHLRIHMNSSETRCRRFLYASVGRPNWAGCRPRLVPAGALARADHYGGDRQSLPDARRCLRPSAATLPAAATAARRGVRPAGACSRRDTRVPPPSTRPGQFRNARRHCRQVAPTTGRAGPPFFRRGPPTPAAVAAVEAGEAAKPRAGPAGGR